MGRDHIIVTRLGDDTHNTISRGFGIALPVNLEAYNVITGARVMSIPARGSSASGSGHAPCTLSVADPADSSRWYWDAESMPSLSGDGRFVMFPCHAAAAGEGGVSMVLGDHVIALFNSSGRSDTTTRVAAFYGFRGTSGGLRNVVSPDAQEFWLSGNAMFSFGIRYLASRTARTTTPVHGMLGEFVDDGGPRPSVSPLPGFIGGNGLPVGYEDLRGVALRRDTLYAWSSARTETAPPHGGVWTIGVPGILPRAQTPYEMPLPGWTQSRSWWGMHWQNDATMWALEDTGSYTRIDVFELGIHKRFRRDSTATRLTCWRYSNTDGRWSEDRAQRLTLPGGAISVTGRDEEDGVHVLYTTTATALLRIVTSRTSAPVVSTIATLSSSLGRAWRGVALPPRSAAAPVDALGTPTLSRAPSSSRTPTRTPPATRSPQAASRSRTASRKARGALRA